MSNPADVSWAGVLNATVVDYAIIDAAVTADFDEDAEPDHRYVPRRGDTLKREGWRAVHPAEHDIQKGDVLTLVKTKDHPRTPTFAWARWHWPATKLGTALRDFTAGELIKPHELGADIPPEAPEAGS